MKSRKNNCDLGFILPDKNYLSQTFWHIIQVCPVGNLLFIIMMIIEELVKVFIVSRIAFDIPFFEKTLQSINNNTDMPSTIMIISIVLIAYHLFNLLVIWCIYRSLKNLVEQSNITTLIQILMKYMGVYFTAANTFFTMLIHIYMVEVLFLIFGSEVFKNNKDGQIINLVLIVILTMIILLFELILSNFFNLNFINEVLICSRPSTQKFEYFRLFQHTALIALSLQQNLNVTSRAISLIAIAVLAYLQLFRCSYFITYYNERINKFNLVVEIFKTSFFTSLIITVVANLNYKNFFVLYFIVLLSKIGIVIYLKNQFTTNLYQRLIHGEIKSPTQIERILYQLLYQCQSKDFEEHKKFLKMMIEYEEQDMEEESQSYYKVIVEILAYKQSSDQIHNQHEKEKMELLEKEYKKYEDASIDFGSITLDNFLPINTQELDADRKQQFSPGTTQNTAYNASHQSLIKTVLNVLSANYEQSKSSLFEVFSNDTVAKKKISDDSKKEKIYIQVDGHKVDVTNYEEAIMNMKHQFLYNVVAKKASIMFPDSQTVMFYKAFLTSALLNNRHLTLTTITHINTQEKDKDKIGFFKQVESLISQNYFVDTSITKNPIVEELDSQMLLNQSIKIDEILNQIKECTEKIAIFWQIMASDNVSKEQIEDLLKVSYDISLMLKQIKSNLVQMTSSDNFQSSCHSLYFYLCHFYNIVMRDSHQSQVILKHMMNMQSVRMQSQMKTSLIDDVGLVVVDGNFSLFGKMIFANKTICKLLGYKTEELVNQKIHMLMPNQISEVHNKFWTRFSEVGIPKVLEQVRYLYIKDKEGFVTPFKIFIKFLYHKDFGYCFIGLFRRPKSVIFDDQESQVKTRKTYTLICNENGKIQEISKTCHSLMKIRPEMLDKFHQSLTDNFTIGHFNPQLQISCLDFSQNNCYFYRYINLNFGIIEKISKITEYMEELELSANKIRNSFKVQMKIIKETYGCSRSASLSLYYVIFSEFNNNQNTMHNISGNSTTNQTANRLTIQSINNYETFESEGDSDNLFFSQKDDKYKLSSINCKSISTESIMNMNNNSISSSFSGSQTSDQNSEIKYIEEGIDYDKNPRPLIYLRLAIVILLFMSLVLSTIEFVLNLRSNNQNIDYQKMLARTVQAEESVSSLILLTRSYVSINLGFETNNSTYVSNRRELIRNQALLLLEDTRVNMMILQQFINQIQDDESFKNHFTNMSVRIYDIHLNKTVYSRKLSRFYSINDWIVKINEIFQTPNFTSKLYSFYPQNYTITNPDQLLFSVFTNSQNELRTKLIIFNDECEQFIQNQVDKSNFTNKIYVIITSIVIVIFTLITLYYLLFLNQFKYQVLDFFAELEKSCIILNEQCAIEFSQYLRTDNYDIIKQNEKYQRQYEMLKTQNNISGVIGQDIQPDKSKQVNQTNHKKHKQQKIVSKFLRQITKRNEGKENSSQFSESFEEDDVPQIVIEEIKENSQEDVETPEIIKGKGGGKFKVNKKSNNNIDGNFKKQSKFKGKNLDEISSNRMDLKKLSQQKRRDSEMNTDMISFEKNKFILQRLKELKMKKLTQMFVIGTMTSFILIIYFAVQHLLFEKSQISLSQNSVVLKEIQQSLECTSNFLYKIRDIQITNSSTYMLNDQKSIPLQQVLDLNQISVLNTTYQNCIKHNQYVDHWINEKNQAEFYQNKNKENICTFLSKKEMFDESLTFENCNSIYQGILKKNVLYQTSLFLQDSFQIALKFGSIKDKNEANIKQSIAQLNLIDLLDSVSMFQQFGLRKFYSEIFDELLMQKSAFIILLSIYIVFAVLLVIGQMIVNCYITPFIRNSFWNSFYILKLLPKDELGRDFIKRVNDFLNKA